MPPFSHLPSDHPKLPQRKIGVLLINLGTPDGFDYFSMRRYLKEFLSDRRVIEVNRLLWTPLLYLVILMTRPFRSGKAYASIWDREKNESPLRTLTREQSVGLANRFSNHGDALHIDWAMRYGTPSIDDKLRDMHRQGCDRILCLPLYPQYAAATTASVSDAIAKTMMKMRWQPSLRIAPPYYDAKFYIENLAKSAKESIEKLDFTPDFLVASFHGIPKSYFMKGDPYHCHCQKTARLLREALNWDEKKYAATFQSRFGKEEWLKPYTDKTLASLAQKGVKRLAIIAPGFAADCLETLEELAVENRDVFLSNGGEKFAYLPALNASRYGLNVLEAITQRELKGWISD